MTLDTRALLGAVILFLALLALHSELVPTLKPLGAAACWCLRKLCWLLAVVAWASVTLLAALIVAMVIIIAWVLESPRDRRMTLAARRRFS